MEWYFWWGLRGCGTMRLFKCVRHEVGLVCSDCSETLGRLHVAPCDNYNVVVLDVVHMVVRMNLVFAVVPQLQRAIVPKLPLCYVLQILQCVWLAYSDAKP